MSEFIDEQLIKEVAHDLVEEVAPQELPIFGYLACKGARYFRHSYSTEVFPKLIVVI